MLSRRRRKRDDTSDQDRKSRRRLNAHDQYRREDYYRDHKRRRSSSPNSKKRSRPSRERSRKQRHRNRRRHRDDDEDSCFWHPRRGKSVERRRQDNDGEDTKKKELCLDFLYNKCERGDACRFLHAKEDHDAQDRMSRLFKNTEIRTLAEVNAELRYAREKKEEAPSLERQLEIDQVLPLLEPLPEAYKEALLAIPDCVKHLDTRHVKTLMRLSAKHAMAALHEFKEALSENQSTIRNRGGYMMGVLRKYLPGEVASGLTYDGSLLELGTGATDPYKANDVTVKPFEDPEFLKEARRQDIERRQAQASMYKSQRLLADVSNLVEHKLKEALRLEPKLNTLYAWKERVDISNEELDPRYATAILNSSQSISSVLSCFGAERVQNEYEGYFDMHSLESTPIPLVFASAVLPLSLPALIDAIDNPRHESAHPEAWTRRRDLTYRYDARTMLLREIGMRIAPLLLAHDRSVIVAWRPVPGRPSAWIRIRFSVTTALLPPDLNKYQRAAVPIQAYLLEPVSKNQTRCTTWGIEELQTPRWLQEHYIYLQKILPLDFYKRLAMCLYISFLPVPQLASALPEAWQEQDQDQQKDEIKETKITTSEESWI